MRTVLYAWCGVMAVFALTALATLAWLKLAFPGW